MKKWAAFGLSLMMVLSMGMTAFGADLSGSGEFVAGTSAPEGSTIDTLMNHIAETLSEQTEGKYTLTHYGASQLGGDAEMVTEVQSGNVDITAMTTANLVGAVPELAVFDMQGAVPSAEVLTKMMKDEEFSETVQGWFEKAGFHLLTYCPSSIKGLGSNVYVDSADVFKNYTMRVLNNKYHIAFWEAAGANTVQIAASELYLAIQQGMADGLEMDMHGFIKFKVSEVIKYVYESHLLMHMSVVVMNLDKWNSLEESDRAWLEGYFDEVTDYYTQLGLEDDEHSWEELAEEGVEKIEFNQEVFDNLKAVAEETVWPMVREDLGDEVVDEFLAAIERNS